jgi:hypothetical protein
MRGLLKQLAIPLIAVAGVDFAIRLYGGLQRPEILLNLAVAAITVGFMGVRELILRANRQAVFARVDERLMATAPGTDPMTVLRRGSRQAVDQRPQVLAPEIDPFATLALRAAWLHLGMGLESEKLVSALRHHMISIGDSNVSDDDLRLAVQGLPLTLSEFSSAEPHSKEEMGAIASEVLFGSIMVVGVYFVARMVLDGFAKALG